MFFLLCYLPGDQPILVASEFGRCTHTSKAIQLMGSSSGISVFFTSSSFKVSSSKETVIITPGGVQVPIMRWCLTMLAVASFCGTRLSCGGSPCTRSCCFEMYSWIALQLATIVPSRRVFRLPGVPSEGGALVLMTLNCEGKRAGKTSSTSAPF
jgi:hypothetical protein